LSVRFNDNSAVAFFLGHPVEDAGDDDDDYVDVCVCVCVCKKQ